MKEIETKDLKTSSHDKELWLEEIVRETDHYFQGEIQQDQRSSWVLATSGLLIAVVVSIEVTAVENQWAFSQPVIVVALIALVLSSILSILTIVPLSGRHFWSEISCKSFQYTSRLEISDLIQKRFHISDDWSFTDYEKRIMYHFKSHYLRNIRKGYGVFWSSFFLLLGLLLLAFEAIVLLFFQ